MLLVIKTVTFGQTLLWQSRSRARVLPAVSSVLGCSERPPTMSKTHTQYQ